MGNDGTDTTQYGLLGKIFHDVMNILLGQNPVLGITTIVAIVVAIVAAGIAVWQFGAALIAWIKKEKKSVVVEHLIKGIVAFAVTALIGVIASVIISHISSNYGR